LLPAGRRPARDLSLVRGWEGGPKFQKNWEGGKFKRGELDNSL